MGGVLSSVGMDVRVAVLPKVVGTRSQNGARSVCAR